MAPGPTEVPPDVLQAQAREITYHRGPRYGALLGGCRDALKRVLFTRGDVLLFTGSGTLGMESAIVNTCSPGDRVLICDTGNFGERFRKIAAVHGVDATVITYEWGRNAKPEDVADALASDPSIKAVFAQHSETSTGIVNDVEAIGAVVKDTPALFVVDAISGVGAAPLRVDDWGIDVCVGGSQKALMAPPGLCFVSVSEAAWTANADATCPRFYTDWATAKKSMDADPPENPYTPAVTLVAALSKALELLEQEGMDAVWKRHEVLSRACREGVKAIGLDIFTEEADRAVVLTAVVAPEELDAGTIAEYIRRVHGIVLAPGQGKLKGKVFRIGHCGYYAPVDIIKVLSVLESSLAALGYPVKAGAAVEAATTVFREEGVA